MERISKDVLKTQIEILNRIRPDAGWRLSGAYGGWQLTYRNGSRVPFPHGHTTKRDLWQRVNAFIQGLQFDHYLEGDH